MEQRACASGHQCLEKAVCVCVLLPREHHSWGCPCRIRGVGIGYGGGWIPERDQRSGSQILAWPEVCTSYRGTHVCMFMCVCVHVYVCVCVSVQLQQPDWSCRLIPAITGMSWPPKDQPRADQWQTGRVWAEHGMVPCVTPGMTSPLPTIKPPC